jgi:putative ABC transport system substrate-binding protein
MKRREFITLVGGAAASLPLTVRAQQPSTPVIGFLNSASPKQYAPMVAAFRQGLSAAGYVEGQNVAIEYRWAEGHNDRLAELAADLVRREVKLIAVPGSTPGTMAAKAATTTIPIIFAIASDPVKLGLVTSLNKPGGNLTGVTLLGTELAPKQLELLHELIPAATVMALLINPTSPALAEIQSRDLQAAAATLGLNLHVVRASIEDDFETVFATLTKLRAGGLVIGSDAFFTSRVQMLADLSISHSIPAIYWQREYTAVGGLMSYGTSYIELYRQAGAYAGRILKGEKPADLPVQQSTKVELVVNLKTAKALGVTVPLSLLGRADHVME